MEEAIPFLLKLIYRCLAAALWPHHGVIFGAYLALYFLCPLNYKDYSVEFLHGGSHSLSPELHIPQSRRNAFSSAMAPVLAVLYFFLPVPPELHMLQH